MRSHVRPFIRLGVVLLVARVVVDVATPLLPGAFSLDPATLVQAVEADRPVAAAAPAPPSGAPGRDAPIRMAQPRRAPAPAPRARAFVPRILHLSEASPSPSADDD
jgi:hypothetical protein